MTDITELTSVQKNANIHRLSRIIAYAPNDELRQMAVEVEHYTDQLIEALEKAQQRITQMESRTVTDWIEHDGKWRPESLGLDELVYLKTRKQELKIPYPAGKVKGWMNTGGDMDVMAYKLASPQASTVTVKLTDINEYLAEVHDKTLNRALRLLAEGVRAGDVAAMRAAGIKVEAE
ncbi:hypothetical protein QYQ35_06325 [Klebsiella pneumoniae]|uniref:hypothetical protein n=2 Tax=Klebsiella pneumoniae TaxID=573 RepID=UPI00188864E2|nr:hypothetical protein [Klebsiella pneumoniae]MBF2767964.1 hypothetical protein [Klebsiella pneumoniae]MBF2809807.1 hypothetical protein [Klebsiella pneumoniae]QPP56942.1 hypothetical protein I5M62_05095 [Klebsiella pneumoniae]QPP78567.1 hypothetical protein I5M57_05730 [Klebsiella pneumoniae]WKG97724.1 hypothetical protein QYQ92_06320 [Klebsiella pneumoniae]